MSVSLRRSIPAWILFCTVLDGLQAIRYTENSACFRITKYTRLADMDIFKARDDARKFLMAHRNLSELSRETGISRSWIMKFKAGEINNPTTDRLHEILVYKKRYGKSRSAA